MSKFTVLSLGEFIQQDGIDIALESFAELFHEVTSKHQKQMKLVMVTKGILTEYIEKKSKRLDIEKSVELISWSQQETIEHFYNEASILLLPSTNDISKLVTEAFSFGLPVVCFEDENLFETIDATCGMMVERADISKNISNFSDLMRMLYFDPEARKIMKKGAMKKYETQFSWGYSKVSA